MEFKDRLKSLRESAGLTQEELGKKINLTKANISKYELGRLQPNIETLLFLADYFAVTLDYLLGRSDNPDEILITNKELEPYLPDELKGQDIKTFLDKNFEPTEENLNFLTQFILEKIQERNKK